MKRLASLILLLICSLLILAGCGPTPPLPTPPPESTAQPGATAPPGSEVPSPPEPPLMPEAPSPPEPPPMPEPPSSPEPPTLSEIEVIKIEPEPQEGFYWAYYLYIPDSLRVSAQENGKTYLLVEPNNTGYPSDDYEVHDMAAKETAQRMSGTAEGLRVPLLVPAFPRPEDRKYYTHALDRRTLLMKQEEMQRIDLQLIAMIDDAAERLSLEGVNLEEKVLMMGFSASGMFANRFTVLHPEKVQAAAIGSPGGWPIVPVDEWNGVNLRYPIGAWDIEEIVGEEFDVESFKSVPLYFYLGDEDTNDSVPPLDGWDSEDKKLIFKYFGDLPVERWPIAEEIYNSVGCSSQFVLYPGVEHTVTDEMMEDAKTFLLNNLESR